MMRKLLVALILILSVAPLQARADMAKFEAALALFAEAALFGSDGELNGNVLRFQSGLRVHFSAAATAAIRARAERLTREAAEIAGLPVEIVDDAQTANVTFAFFEPSAAPPVLRGDCSSQTYRTGAVQTAAVVQVRNDQGHCLPHEILHAFGLSGHPASRESALNPANDGSRGFSELDRLALRTLYRADIGSGTFHLPALEKARDFLARDLGVLPPGGNAADLARPFVDAQLERLRAARDPFVQMQLGHAYWYAHYVAKNPPEAVRFWRLAASQKNREAMFELAVALTGREGIPRDFPAARTLAGEASALGHGRAALVLGILWREGAGGPEDAVEAFAYFDLAHRRGVASATSLRDQLANDFDAATKARAMARAAELPTEPPRPAQ
jgi:hypothetical protein